MERRKKSNDVRSCLIEPEWQNAFQGGPALYSKETSDLMAKISESEPDKKGLEEDIKEIFGHQ